MIYSTSGCRQIQGHPSQLRVGNEGLGPADGKVQSNGDRVTFPQIAHIATDVALLPSAQRLSRLGPDRNHAFREYVGEHDACGRSRAAVANGQGVDGRFTWDNLNRPRDLDRQIGGRWQPRLDRRSRDGQGCVGGDAGWDGSPRKKRCVCWCYRGVSLFGAGAQQKEAPTYHNRNCCFGLEIVPNFVNGHFISQIIDQILKSKPS